jgi:hypothetical protein
MIGFLKGQNVFLNTIMYGEFLGPHQPFVEWASEGVFPGIKQQECEANHSSTN